jgi:hypothetical protein
MECPRSLVTAESAAMVERFWIWHRGGARLSAKTAAREAEAMVALQGEMEREKRDDDRRSTG